MHYLGIDFGLKKVGVALAVNFLAEPYTVIRNANKQEVVVKIVKIIEKEEVGCVIIGLSDGIMKEKIVQLADLLKKRVSVTVKYADEAWSTQIAQRLSLEAGMKRTKRKKMEDAFAATIMLQSYLDNYV